jgi:hypothetical protein
MDMSSSHDRARMLAIAQDFGPEALRLNEELVAANPGDLASRTRLARCQVQAGRLEDAEAQYREVLRLDQKNRIAAGGLLSIAEIRRRAEVGFEEPVVARAPRAPRAAGVRRSPAAVRTHDEPDAPLAFSGLQPRDFAELRFSQPREVRVRFAPRVVDLVKRVNALKSSEEISQVREAGRRQLFRASRTDVHVDPAEWFVYNSGGRWEPHFTIGMYAGRRKAGDWLCVGIGFRLTDEGEAAAGDGSLSQARNHFRRFQALLGSAPRSLFLGWMIKENGLIEVNGSGPRADLQQPSQAAELIVGCEPDRTLGVFFGKWMSPDNPEDAAVLADPVELVRTIDRVFTGLLPLWRALWEPAR